LAVDLHEFFLEATTVQINTKFLVVLAILIPPSLETLMRIGLCRLRALSRISGGG
jgi:hypothetical protein